MSHDIEDSFGDFGKQIMGDMEWDAAVGYAADDSEDEDACWYVTLAASP